MQPLGWCPSAKRTLQTRELRPWLLLRLSLTLRLIQLQKLFSSLIANILTELPLKQKYILYFADRIENETELK